MYRLLIGVVFGLALARPAGAQGGPRVTGDTAFVNFPDGINFMLAAESDRPITRAVLRYGAEGRSCLASEARQALSLDPATAIQAEWEWDFTRTGVLPPGVRFWRQWEVEDDRGAQTLTEKQWDIIVDPRFDWQSVARDAVTVTWAEGNQAFGQALLDLGLASLDRLEREMGVRPDGPVSLLIYPNTDQLTESFVSLPEWTGGVALPAYNVVVTAIEPGQDAWAASVVPHELAHLVVGARVFNCRGVNLPTWLNEGLAVIAEGPAAPEDVDRVQRALDAGSLPTLRSLANGFQAEAGRANLAYAQSAEVVRYLIREHSADRLGELLDEVQRGQTIDLALEAVYGFNTDGLDSAWRVSEGAAPLPTSQPTLAAAERTAVPTLALWTAAPVTETAVSSAAATSTPRAVTQATAATPGSTSTPIVTAEATIGDSAFPWLAVGGLCAAGILAAALAGVLVKRGRQAAASKMGPRRR